MWELAFLEVSHSTLILGLHWLAIGTPRNKFRYVPLQTIPLIDLLNVMMHLGWIWWIEYRDTWDSLRIQFLKLSTFGTHILPLYLSTISPPRENDSLSLQRIESFNTNNKRSRFYLVFTLTTKDYSELWWTIKPPFRESYYWTLNRGNLWTSFTRSL